MCEMNKKMFWGFVRNGLSYVCCIQVCVVILSRALTDYWVLDI